MQTVVWKDKRGFPRRSTLRDNDDPNHPERGIPADPPDMRMLDWDGLTLDVQRVLVEEGILTLQDLQASQTAFPALVSLFKRRIVDRYRASQEAHKEG